MQRIIGTRESLILHYRGVIRIVIVARARLPVGGKRQRLWS